jgi:hypothetical protein
MWSASRFYKQGTKLVVSSFEFSRESGKTGLGAGGAEEFRMLEAVAREQLKTADSKRLSGGVVVICEL